jgi:GNAT superfamily N-acetyltransferase
MSGRTSGMRGRVAVAGVEDAEEVARVRMAAGRALTERYGVGPWSGTVTARGVLGPRWMGAVIYVLRRRGAIAASFTLQQRKPWSIKRELFTPKRKPVYLVSMAVDPKQQGNGLGRVCLREAARLGREMGCDALCLDAFDAEAGAGEFYLKCGLREVGRGAYREVPLRYFEMLL